MARPTAMSIGARSGASDLQSAQDARQVEGACLICLRILSIRKTGEENKSSSLISSTGCKDIPNRRLTWHRSAGP
jgi:hypothetical protein